MSNATQWVLDPSHSELSFKVKHLMISNVKGEFKFFSAEVIGDPFTKAQVKANIDTQSIFTNEDARDNHLKSADFFDVENFPTMTFESSDFKAIEDDSFSLKGILTIKGISNEISLEVEFGGISKDPWGNEKAGFSFSGKINRKDFGLHWNATLETGGVLVSEEIKLSGEVQFVKQA